MARAGIQFEQVAAVADALMGEGQPPTIRAVRERLDEIRRAKGQEAKH